MDVNTGEIDGSRWPEDLEDPSTALYTRSIRSLLVDLMGHEASCLERTIHCPAPNGCDEVVQLKVATIWLDDCGSNIGFEKFTFPF